MKSALLALFVVARLVDAQTVFQSDFDGSLPAQIQPGSAQLTAVQGFSGLGPAGRTFNGNFLRSPTANKVTLQLTGLPSHRAVNLAFLMAAIDSLDGAGSFPSGDYKVSYPTGPTPYFTGVVNGAAPRASVTLQASTDLGKIDVWQNLSSGTANENGAVSFLDVPDPSAAGAARNFYRAVATGP